MTTFQNAPAPQRGRHQRAESSDHPVQYTGPRPADQPQTWHQPPRHVTGPQPRIPAQWNPGPAHPSGQAPSYASGPAGARQPHPGAAPARQAQAAHGAPAAGQARPAPSYGAPSVPTHQAPAMSRTAPPTEAPGYGAPSPFDAPTRTSTPAAQAPVPGPPQQAPVYVVAPRNGLGIAALCLGIVGMLFGLIPFTGFIAFGLGAIGIILGLVGFARARRRVATNTKTAVSGVVLSLIAIALGIWGMVILFTGLNQLSEDLNQISAPTGTTTGGTAVPADVSTPATGGATTYQLEVTGDASKMMVAYGTNNATSSTADYQSLPWRKTVDANGDFPYASVTATSFGPGSITCTITDTATGAVVATQTSKSLDDSEYSSANVSCNTMG